MSSIIKPGVRVRVKRDGAYFRWTLWKWGDYQTQSANVYKTREAARFAGMRRYRKEENEK